MRIFRLALLVYLTWAFSYQAQQTIYWKKDHIQDNHGTTIAVATPLPSDQTAPTAPSALNYSNLTSTSVTLNWSGATDSGGSGLAGYKVYRGVLPVGTVGPLATSFMDDAFRTSVNYSYSVVAFDNAGNHSSPSNTINFGAPSGLTATRVSSTQINLAWTDNSTDEDGFRIERKIGDGGSYAFVTNVAAGTVSYPNTGLNDGTVYYYRVGAYKGASTVFSPDAYACTCIVISGNGVYDDYNSNIVYTGTGWGNNNTFPFAYSSTWHYSNNSQAKATFSFAGDLVRAVLLKAFSLGIVNVTIDGIDKGNLDLYAPSNTYRFTQAYSGLGTGNHTITVTITGTKNASSTGTWLDFDAFAVNDDVTPAPASNLAANRVSGTQVNLTWTDNSYNEDGFRIERKVAGGSYSLLTTVAAGSTSHSDTNAVNAATTYYYRVGSYKGTLTPEFTPDVAAPPPQPTSMSISPGSVEQGQCYTITVGNAPNMTIDVQYNLNGGATDTVPGWSTLNSSGQATHCVDSNAAVGLYTITAVRNTYNTAWVTVSAGVNVTPRQPTSFSISPSSVAQGSCYTSTVGNGSNMTIDVQYNFNGGATDTVYGWASLDSNGQAVSCTDLNTAQGTYTITAVRNSLNSAWVSVNASVTVTSLRD